MDYNITYRKKDNGIQVIISYKDNLGKWRQKSKQGFPDTREGNKKAKIAADLMLQDLKSSINLNTDFKNITFKEFSNIYIGHVSLHLEAKTLTSYNSALKNFSLLNDMELSKIRSIHIQRCIDNMIKKNLKSSSIKINLSKIKTIFKSAVEQYNLINDTPVKNIKFQPDKIKNEKRALNSKELNDLLYKLSIKPKYIHFYMMSVIASKCGLRLGEILGLRWSDIDLNNKKLTVKNQLKLNKEGKHVLGTLKSKNSIRTVPIPKNIVPIFEKYKKDTPTLIDNRVIKYSSVNGAGSNIQRAFKDVGYDISIHELRHTYITNLVANGLDFKTISKIAGHSVEMVMSIYSHVTDEMLERASSLIDNIL